MPPTATENAAAIKELAERVTALEKFETEVRWGNRTFWAAWGSLGITALAIGAFIWSFATLASNVSTNAKEIERLAKDHEKAVDKLHSEVKAVNEFNQFLRVQVGILMDRPRAGKVEMLVHEGIIVRMKDDMIAILPEGRLELSREFRFKPGEADVDIDGKKSKYENLKFGMLARVTYAGDDGIRIIAETIPPPPKR